jgi:hypothetical protein
VDRAVSHFDTVGLDQKTIDNDCESGDRREDEKKFRHHLWTPRWLARSVQRQLQSDCNLSGGRNKAQQFLAAWQKSQFEVVRATLHRLHRVSRSRSGCAKSNRSHPRWTSRFLDPEGRESATPFPRWFCFHGGKSVTNGYRAALRFHAARPLGFAL